MMLMAYTVDEVIALLKDRYSSDEIIEVIDITVDDLIYHLGEYIEDNFEKIHKNMIQDEQNHFGLTYGEDNDS